MFRSNSSSLWSLGALAALSLSLLIAGPFTTRALAVEPPLTFVPAAGSPFATGGTQVVNTAVADFNGDGKQDLAADNQTQNNVSVLLGDGNGGFTSAPGSPFAVGGSCPVWVAAGDFNGDGKPDLATANACSNDVSVLLGGGQGGFTSAPGSPFPTHGSNASFIAVADINGDGNQDLVVSSSLSVDVSVLLGDGNGGFTSASGSPFPMPGVREYSTNTTAVGDFNHDGYADVAVSDTFAHNVSVLLGDSAGRLTNAPGSPYGMGTAEPTYVSAGDLNGDGKPDLAVATEIGSPIVLLGDGAGGFVQASQSPIPAAAGNGVAIADYNGDGKPDLAIGDGGGGVNVLLGDGSGGFSLASGSPFPTAGNCSYYLTAGNINGDGRPDLSVANACSNNVSVLLNEPALAITAVSPASGPLAGGTSVAITGSGFTGATAVKFGSTAASAFTVNSDTSITATSPAAASVGPVDVTATTPAGTSATSRADQFTYTYPFTGYQAPVANPPVLNQVNRGQAIPMKFSLGGNYGLTIIAPGYPTATPISCSTGAPVNSGTLTDTAGGSGLQYDSGTGTYTYVWKTSKSWAGTCQQFDLRLNDGTDHTANFQFK